MFDRRFRNQLFTPVPSNPLVVVIRPKPKLHYKSRQQCIPLFHLPPPCSRLHKPTQRPHTWLPKGNLWAASSFSPSPPKFPALLASELPSARTHSLSQGPRRPPRALPRFRGSAARGSAPSAQNKRCPRVPRSFPNTLKPSPAPWLRTLALQGAPKEGTQNAPFPRWRRRPASDRDATGTAV